MLEAIKGPRWWTPLWEFLTHVLLATAIFVLIALAGVALDLFSQWLTTLKVSSVILIGLQLAKYTLFVTDICLFEVYLVRTAWRTLSRL